MGSDCVSIETRYEFAKEDGICPYCGSKDLEHDDVYKRIKCSECNYSSAKCDGGVNEFLPRPSIVGVCDE